MRINAIALKDFTRYAATTVAIEETVNVIVGRNNSGKSSLVDAITYCLTGHCGRTDKAGRGAEAMIRTGAREASIDLRLGAEETVVSRSIPGGLSVSSLHGGQRDLQELVYEMLGAHDGAVTAALNTHAFVDLRPDEQKAMLFGLLGLDLGPQQIIETVAEEAAKITSGPVAREMLDAVPKKILLGEPAETFGRLYKHFYDLRRDYKRRLKDMGEPVALQAVPDLGDRDSITAELTGLRELLSEVRQRQAQAAEMRRRQESMAEEIEALRVQCEESVDTRAMQAQLEVVREEVATIEREAREAGATADGLRRACGVLEGASGRDCIATHDLAPGAVTCPLTKPKRQAVIDTLTAQEGELRAAAEKATSAALLLVPRLVELQQLASAPDRPRLEGMISEREKLLEEMPDPPDTRMAAVEIADIEGRISSLESRFEDIVRYAGAQEVREEQAVKRARIAEAIETLEALVQLTGPKGIPGRMLAETIEPLTALANERLLQLTGGRYELDIAIDHNLGITVRHDGCESDLAGLSASEQMRVGIILQDAISRLAGLRMLVIDSADILDQENRQMLTGWLLSIADDYDTILVLSTGLPETTIDPGIDGVAVYAISDDGQIGRVRAREEALA